MYILAASVRFISLFTFVGLTVWFMPIHAQANQLHVVANVTAYHFDRKSNLNEKNWGSGLQYSFAEARNLIPFLAFGSFKDSFGDTSRYLGGGVQRRFHLSATQENYHFDIGISAFFMTRETYNKGKPFPAALPFIAVGNDQLSLNIAYVPELKFNQSGIFFVQAMLNFAEF